MILLELRFHFLLGEIQTKLRKFKGESRFDEMERGEKSKLGKG